MSLRNPYSMHYQSVWHERTGDRRLPAWLRVSFLAYGAHRANGHARFKPGEIGLILGTVDPTDGEISPMDKSNVGRAIRSAVGSGWLAEGSGSLCLIVPAHAVFGGIGNAHEKCPIHMRKAQRSKSRGGHSVTHLEPQGRSPSDHAVGHPVTTDKPLTCTNAKALYDSSTHPQPGSSPEPQESRPAS